MGEELKAELVKEICGTASAFASCAHHHRPSQLHPFIDWYLILRADEDAETEQIRKKYRQLALQLHPDKNDHPRAEVAFKLISEAYECLTDKAGRIAFNLERRKYYCKECHRKLLSSSHKNHDEIKIHKCYNAEQRKSYGVPQSRKEVCNKLREECEVIEKCLRANGASGGESPLFDPSDHPHRRSRVYAKPQDFSYFNAHKSRNRYGWEMGCESPVYEIRSQSRQRRTKINIFST